MIPAFLIDRFGKAGATVLFWSGVATLVVLAGLLTYCVGRGDGKSGEVIKQQDREIAVQGEINTATGNAATTRVADAVKTETQRKDLDDALKETDPDRLRIARGCLVLKQQGRDTSGLPVCR